MTHFIGAHVSASGGLENAPRNARALGATGFALFTKNQRQWSAAPLTAAQIDAFRRACDEAGYAASAILPHDSYLINLGHPDDEALEKSRRAFDGDSTASTSTPGATCGPSPRRRRSTASPRASTARWPRLGG